MGAGRRAGSRRGSETMRKALVMLVAGTIISGVAAYVASVGAVPANAAVIAR